MLEHSEKGDGMRKLLLTLAGVLAATVASAATVPYDYPFVNPYDATVLGTPSYYQAILPEDIPVKELSLRVFEDREIPNVFWYQQGLRYSLAPQKAEAPLIFIIAGTGAGHRSSKMQFMERLFYEAGFHVICLPSPTVSNFIVTASESMVPGNLVDDSRDLYRVMGLAWNQVRSRIEVSDFCLTGYSLGATQAAYVAKLDEEKGLFGFKKVLMINPAVSLFNSVSILDTMLVENIPGGPGHFNEFFEKMMKKFSSIYRTMGHVDFSGDFLYEVSKRYPPKEITLAALIGISFRLSSANMVFTTDVMTHAGLVVPANRRLSAYDSLTEYQKVTNRISFNDYFNDLFYPFFHARDPGLTRDALIAQSSLKPIEDYLARSGKIALLTNADDLILAPGELAYLEALFGPRAQIYPTGGHCGNLTHQAVTNHMLEFFRN
jgi:hypothetical protein